MAPHIRLATAEDAPQILDIYAPIVAQTVISFELAPPSLTEMQQRISSLSLRYPWLVCEQAGQVWGYAYASPYRVRAAYQWSVDVSAYVHEHCRRRGVGQALYTSLFEVLRCQGYINAYACIALPNPASLRLHQSVGFEPVGVYRQVGFKLGAWHDVSWWQLALRERDRAPAPARSMAEVQALPDFASALEAGLSRLHPPKEF